MGNLTKSTKISDPLWAKHPTLKPGVGRMLELMCGQTSSDEELLNLHTEDSPDGGSRYLQIPTSSRSRSKKSVLKPLTELSDEERVEKLKQQTLTNDFHKFVEGEIIDFTPLQKKMNFRRKNTINSMVEYNLLS